MTEEQTAWLQLLKKRDDKNRCPCGHFPAGDAICWGCDECDKATATFKPCRGCYTEAECREAVKCFAALSRS